jgi:predicted nuclease with TOPRIM domain
MDPAPAKVVMAPAPAKVVMAPAPAKVVITRQSVVDEIIQAKTKSNTKLTTFQTKLVSLLKENSDEQLKVETENRNNFNGVSVTLQNEKNRLEAARSHMKKLYDESQLLNKTIHKHYTRLIADTNYLQSLDAMRPEFLKSLGELAVHIQNVKTVVDTKIVKDEYKDEMVRLLSGIHFNTHNISGYVATAFINHYNKYKNMIRTENQDYSEEMKKLTELSNEYKVQQQKTADIEKERTRLEDILSKLKDSLAISVSQREEFDVLVKEIMSIFDKGMCSPQRR